MTTKHERLRDARVSAGYESAAAAAGRFGWTSSTYAGHENGSRGFKDDTAAQYAKAFRVSPEWILFGRGKDTPEPGIAIADPNGGDTLIPIYNVQASAGAGAVVDGEDVIDRLAFPPDYLRHITKSHPRHLAIIGVKGDSMSPTLKDDDVVMIDTSKTDLSYEGLFVIKIDGGAALLVKRIGRAARRGYVNVISDNPTHPAVEIVAEDVFPVGKVVWAGMKV